jgi:sporadic carbohydrate cluster protein (TIGR04323 family)
MSDQPFLGYNFAAPICGSSIPQRVQNLCIRDYALTKKLSLSFCVSEYYDFSQSLMLFAQMPLLDQISGIIFYSIELLPINHAKRHRFYQQILESKKTIHFSLEDLQISSQETCGLIEKIYRISRDRRLADTQKKLLKIRYPQTQGTSI